LVVYTVYEPPHATGNPVDRALRLVFVKDGFQWLAALFPWVWLLFKGLWLEFLAFLVLAAGVTWGLQALGAPPSIESIPLLLLQIVFGFEAGWIQSLALERRGWRLLGTVTGRNEAECERRFFEGWLPTQPERARQPGAHAARDRRRQGLKCSASPSSTTAQAISTPQPRLSSVPPAKAMRTPRLWSLPIRTRSPPLIASCSLASEPSPTASAG
jgi:hypothetical protein